MIEEAQKS